MSSILYNIIISPIELIVEFIFEIMYRLVGQRISNQGIAIIGVSLTISLLTLPLYKSADELQNKERLIHKKLNPWINHIKKSFKGDERFMILQAFYKENNYSPLQALNGSISLLLEIPFFVAAYHFLSNLTVLNGASFGPIHNLGVSDNLIHINNVSLNLLPILMTLINCISSYIYLKGFPIKDKIQTYGMALIFLILLYKSPSGLVIYWTCNNIFSLIKNIFYKLRNPRKILLFLIFILGTILSIISFSSGKLNSTKKILFICLFQIIISFPLFIYLINKFSNINKRFIIRKFFISDFDKQSYFLFFLSGLILTLLIGVLIPSSVIVYSPFEFINLKKYENPLTLLVYSSSYSIGFFVLWSGIIYKMINNNNKVIFQKFYFLISIISILNYLLFSGKEGNISSLLKFDIYPEYTKINTLINLIVLLFIFITYFIISKKTNIKNIQTFISLAIVISLFTFGIINIHKTQKKISDNYSLSELIKNNNDANNELIEHKETVFNLSKTGKNVIVFMLDRAINGFFPLCLEEKPELKRQFSGVTYYPNTISFGAHTTLGAPAIFGGYEYTPFEMNKNKNKKLIEKHNEALKVMPVLFDKNNYQVTVCDAPFANYQWIPDLSIYSDYPEIKTMITKGAYTDELIKKYNLNYTDLNMNKRNFFCYGLYNISPICFKNLIYDEGNYYNSKIYKNYEIDFLDNYSVLNFLTEITNINDSDVNTFTMIANDTTHNPCELYKPNYSLIPTVEAASDTINYSFDTEVQKIHYHVNMASFIELGKWFDYLRANNVWNNTKIIIVSDHGYTNDNDSLSLQFFDNMIFNDLNLDLMMINPLLLVKDFDSNDFSINNDFMTNGDVPAIAFNNTIKDPVNPFTGKIINSDEKNKHPQLITNCHEHDVQNIINSYTFNTDNSVWYSVHDNIFDRNNWDVVN